MFSGGIGFYFYDPIPLSSVAEVARQMNGVDLVVNVQGDEPEISGAAIDLAIRLGGVISGEHGIGLEKKRYMERSMDPAAIEANRARWVEEWASIVLR